MKQELKRCPFCGGYSALQYKEEQEFGGTRRYVRAACLNCGISSMYRPVSDLAAAFPNKFSPMFPAEYTPSDGEKEAAEQWNTRFSE